ncbi:putative protein CXorf58 [Rhizoclosmatium sp. JEL0117]|nr:putative protein CXorf58 [Rhizoclosmatium sp. JEL0117]
MIGSFARPIAFAASATFVRPFVPFVPVRFASGLRGTPVRMNILDPVLPKPFAQVLKDRELGKLAIRTVRHLYSLWLIKQRKITVKQFKEDAKVLYINLNRGLARADKSILERAVTSSFASILNPELKRIKRIGFGEWTCGPIDISVVNIVTATAQGDPSSGDKEGLFCQITSRVKSKQSYALYSPDKKLIGGDPTKEIDMEEYVVYERKLSDAHQLAATVIARCWRRWRYRAIFQALKAALYKSERTVSIDIMKKLCPREAEFVTDPIMQPRVRFRFGGEMFPPRIMYKVYTKSKNVHYFCGNRLIESGSQAARDACRVMGTRAFTEIAVSKELYMNSRRIAEPSDVTNRMDFVKYMNEIDSLAPKFGGRNNGWRELSFAGWA